MPMNFKKILCLLIIVCIGVIVTGCESNKFVLKINGLKPSYKFDEPIALTLVNTSSEDQLYFVSLEKKIDGEWREFVQNIEDIKVVSKSLIIRKIESREKLDLKCSIPPLYQGSGEYRLAVYSGISYQDMPKWSSSAFTIKE